MAAMIVVVFFAFKQSAIGDRGSGIGGDQSGFGVRRVQGAGGL